MADLAVSGAAFVCPSPVLEPGGARADGDVAVSKPSQTKRLRPAFVAAIFRAAFLYLA